jgi:hypothetical protein
MKEGNKVCKQASKEGRRKREGNKKASKNGKMRERRRKPHIEGDLQNVPDNFSLFHIIYYQIHSTKDQIHLLL